MSNLVQGLTLGPIFPRNTNGLLFQMICNKTIICILDMEDTDCIKKKKKKSDNN